MGLSCYPEIFGYITAEGAYNSVPDTQLDLTRGKKGGRRIGKEKKGTENMEKGGGYGKRWEEERKERKRGKGIGKGGCSIPHIIFYSLTI